MHKEGCKKKKFASTVRYLQFPHFQERARILNVPNMVEFGKYRIADELWLIAVILIAAWRKDLLLLFSSRGVLKPDLLATAILGLWPKKIRPKVVLYGEMYEPNTGIRGVLERGIVKLADRAVRRYLVSSTDELTVFPRTWGVSPEKMRFCPAYFDPKDDTVVSRGTPDGHIFSGGDSMRDYGPLIEAAKRLPHHKFVICTSRLNGQQDLPDNVKIGPNQRKEYLENLEQAAIVVIPLRKGLYRTTGHFTLLGSMWSKKPTIITESLGVQDYTPDDSALVVDGSPESYVKAIEWVLAPENRSNVDAMCERANRVVKTHFTCKKHIDYILEFMDEIMQEIEYSQTESQRGSHKFI